jgi:hypothetical protein
MNTTRDLTFALTDFAILYYMGTPPLDSQNKWAPLTDPNYLWMRSWIVLSAWFRLVRIFIVFGMMWFLKLSIWDGLPSSMFGIASLIMIIASMSDILILTFLGPNPFLDPNDPQTIAYPSNWASDWKVKTIVFLTYIRLIPEMLGLFADAEAR